MCVFWPVFISLFLFGLLLIFKTFLLSDYFECNLQLLEKKVTLSLSAFCSLHCQGCLNMACIVSLHYYSVTWISKKKKYVTSGFCLYFHWSWSHLSVYFKQAHLKWSQTLCAGFVEYIPGGRSVQCRRKVWGETVTTTSDCVRSYWKTYRPCR